MDAENLKKIIAGHNKKSEEIFINKLILISSMAKPIRATPTLRGEEAEHFVQEMIKRENSPISTIDKILYANVNKNRKYFESFLN
ncbi:MAG: hypothetical protein AB1668_04845 [Nanoarchaeota archaeon]